MNKKEFMRYVRGIKDLAEGYGVNVVLAWAGLFGTMFLVSMLCGAIA